MRRWKIVAAVYDRLCRLRSWRCLTRPVRATNGLLAHTAPRYTWRLLVAAALGVIVGCTAALWVFPHRALAATCVVSSSDHYNVQAAPPNEHHGTRVFNSGSGLYVFGTTPVCIHVSSVPSQDPNDGDFVEVGYISIKSGFVYSYGNCTLTGDGTPHLFRTHLLNGSFYCTDFGKLTPDSYISVAVDDQNGDDNWTFWYGGNQLGSNPVGMDFSLSDSLTNGERYGTSEVGTSFFNGMQYMPLCTSGSCGNTWTDWGASGCSYQGAFDNDPTYSNYLRSPTWVQVSETQKCSY